MQVEITMVSATTRFFLLSILSGFLGCAHAQGYGEPTICIDMPPPGCEWLAPIPDHKRLAAPEDSTAAKDVVLFTDGTNFDDAVTLLFLAKSSRANLRAVYLQGNACTYCAPNC